MRHFLPLSLLICFTFFHLTAAAQTTRLLRFPDIHNDRVVFVYGGDIYAADVDGGAARQLTAHKGQELFPKFSPDGRWIAFSAEYSGTRQVYVMPANGGTPRQLTYYNDVGVMPPRGGFDHQVLGWTRDGKDILFRANRLPWGVRMGRFYTISAEGGLERPLAIPEGGTGSFSPDGKRMAYTPIAREWRTWKRTRGGRAQDIWTFNLETLDAQRLTDHIMTDNQPMWIGERIYFTSDRAFRLNIYSMAVDGEQVKQHTHHKDYDVLWPSDGPGGIVYECGGYIHLFDPNTTTTRQLAITVGSDARQSLPVIKDVSTAIASFELSPNGKRALFDARGDLFTVPAKHGEIRNLTRTQGVREHSPAWSPDGSTIAYLSDQSGEYEIWVRPSHGEGPARRLTNGSATWYFSPQWSPDSKRLAYADVNNGLHWIDVESGTVRDVAKGRRAAITHYRWSPDSRWIVYTSAAPSDLNGIWVYDLQDGTTQLLSSGFSNDYSPVFSADGTHIFFISTRDFNLSFSSFEFRYVYNRAARVYAGALTGSAAPLRPFRSDEQTSDSEKKTDDNNGKGSPRVEIDAEGFADRIVALPGPAANYFSLNATADAVFYLRSDDGPRKLYRYDIKAQKEEEVIEGIRGYTLSADGKSILFHQGTNWGIVASTAGQKSDKGTLDLSRMDMKIDLRLEWKQIFSDAWRLMRDWFYDPGMHGVDWQAVGRQYEQLLPFVSRRSDLDFILGEMVSELNAGHTYVDSGDEPRVERIENGLLGCEFEDDGSAHYRIGKIFRGETWHEAFRSPLAEHGVDVRVGDYLIAVNGQEIPTTENPYRYLENTVGRTVTLSVNSRPTSEDARTVTVRPVNSETQLRFLDWIERRRAIVDSASGGALGYIWIPNTAVEGNRELFRWFYPQARRKGLIIDDRYNGGGFIPYNMIELLEREPLNYWARRSQEPFSAPDVFHQGPKACLINGYSSSGGDAFPYYFRLRGLGTLIGTRTWGGLIGLSGQPAFVDGGSLNIPTFRFMDTEGNWAIENEGVSPDIEVIDRPDEVARGRDPGLERAIEILMEKLERGVPQRPVPPAPPDESR